MAGISAKGYYAVACMYYLSLTKEMIQVKTLASSLSTSAAFIEQILSHLRKEGLVKSSRGANGGFTLAKDPTTITLLDILECVDEKFLQVRQSPEPDLVLDYLWEDIYQKSRSIFSIRLIDLTSLYQPFFYDI